MRIELKKRLMNIAKNQITGDDPSHDYWHALRVMRNAETIAVEENVDLEILIPASLFHDIIIYPKNDNRANKSQKESGFMAEKVLSGIKEFPREKIDNVKKAIWVCSFSKGIKPVDMESRVLQDADMLEATGAISVMRTFSSTGSMKRVFYDPEDPFCENRTPDDHKYALDLFFTRLLKVEERMNTKTAKKISRKRTKFLNQFLGELKSEILVK